MCPTQQTEHRYMLAMKHCVVLLNEILLSMHTVVMQHDSTTHHDLLYKPAFPKLMRLADGIVRIRQYAMHTWGPSTRSYNVRMF